MESSIVTRREMGGRLLWAELAAPPGNVLDRRMIAALSDMLATEAADPGLLAMVFEGRGRHFSFGASVEEHQAPKVRELLPSFHALFAALHRRALPTYACVRGQCLGGGLELAAWCSFIFAAPEAHFGQPEIKLGVFAPVGSLLLEWRLGGGRALDLLLTGRSVTAAEAQALGLVHTVAEDPRGAILLHAERHLADKSPSSLRFAERAARRELGERLATTLPALERLYLEELMETKDAHEGIAAFLEKRPPSWQGGAR